MMWFKRESKSVNEKLNDKQLDNGVVGKLRRKKPVLLKPKDNDRETSTESEKDKRRYSDILDIKASQGKHLFTYCSI